MKLRITILILMLLLSFNGYCQLNIPLHKGLRPVAGWATELPNVRMQKHIDSTQQSMRNDSNLRVKVLNLNKKSSVAIMADTPYSKLSNEDQRLIDRTIESLLDNYREGKTNETVAILNDGTSRFQFLINGGVGNIFQNTPGAGIGILSAGVQCRVTRFKNSQKKNHQIDPHFIYAAWSTSTAKSGDSTNVLKTIIFPELTKSDFIVGWHRDIINGNFIKGWMAEVSLSTYKNTSNKYLFRSESFMAGYQVAFTGDLPNLNVPAGFKVLAYGNVINIDPKYNDGLTRITDSVAIHNTFFNLGLRIQAEVNGATLFFNGKYILNPHEAVTSPDLVRFVYTIGALVSL